MTNILIFLVDVTKDVSPTCDFSEWASGKNYAENYFASREADKFALLILWMIRREWYTNISSED